MDGVKWLFVFGTRPETIKLAPVLQAAGRRSGGIRTRICVSGQHREMLDPVMAYFGLEADFDLNVMQPGQNLIDLSAGILTGLRPVLRRERPDLVVVQGDTTTCFMGALAAFYEGIPVAHVEAGLRSGDKARPFPEELNRRLTDGLTDVFLCPTEQARRNLKNEGFRSENLFVTGNTAVDALLWAREEQAGDARQRELSAQFEMDYSLSLEDNDTVLVTAHRRESFGAGLENICRALGRLVEDMPGIQVVFPMHMNPRVRDTVERRLSGRSRIHLIDPLPYDRFVFLMSRSRLILTDSGGIQEEAPSLGIPVLVMRDKTERPEALRAGTALLAGTGADEIHGAALSLLKDEKERSRMARAVNPFGDGRAGERIVEILHGR